MAELLIATWERLSNVPTHLAHSVDNMTLKNWIRLIACVGAYLLVRPYLIKLSARQQEKQFEKIDAETTASFAKLQPNALRDSRGSKVEIPDSESEGEADGAPQWGKKAKVRQRKVVKKIQEAIEEKGREDDDSNSILDRFVDYEEGVDGW
ncbi:PGA2-like protein [Lachnellula hyalina]|uniref:PGA2-like protein n=1 Tax=Lachnellula hyalina TaxID=1316788 RepID=A0A8H8QWB6_9HELO|nr:PGA2-like protein [Lachnellula hyalina]TVY23360.1 PGA2-like protein [Lachnellula hyalina]